MNSFARIFSRGLLSVLLSAAAMTLLASAAHAQTPSSGTDYNVLQTPQNTDSPGKIEVIEFFWFSCPHCNSFDPYVEEWKKKLPADVVFKRVHVRFNDSFVPQQRLYHTLETMGQADAMMAKIFKAIHVDRVALNNSEQIADFVAKNGIDRAKFLEIYNSFTVQNKVQRAVRLTDAYKVDGVPFIAINGRYTTSPAQAGGSYQYALQVTDYLINQVRAQKAKGATPAPKK